MGRIVDNRIDIKTDEIDRPQMVNYKFWQKVTVAEQWYDAGCWWEGETQKVFFRLVTASDAMIEVYREVDEDQWWLYRVYD